MKRQMLTFIICTLVVLVVSGLYIWLTQSNDVMTLSYVPDPNWSGRYVIKTNLQDDTYCSGIDSQGNIHTVWIYFDYINQTSNLIHTAINAKGRALAKEHTIASAQKIQAFTMAVTNDSVNIFWVGSRAIGLGDLNYARLGADGTLLETNTILADRCVDVKTLQAVTAPTGGFMLAWSDQVGAYRQIKTFAVGAEGTTTAEPIQLTTASYHAYGPNLIVDGKGRFHLAWKEEAQRSDAAALLLQRKYNCKNGVVPINVGYAYTLYYQMLDAQGQGVAQPVFMDEVSLNTVAMTVVEDQLYLAWVKRTARQNAADPSIVGKALPNYAIFGAKLDLTQPVIPTEVFQLSQQKGPAFDQTMIADSAGRIHLVYMDTYTDHLALTHSTFAGDFATVEKEARRIFPDQIVGMRTTLLPDPQKGMHLFWIQSDPYGGTMYYANTIHPRAVSPFQVVGINLDKSGVSSFMSFVYVLTLPIYNILVHLHLFYVTCISVILAGCKYLSRKWRGNQLFYNPYIVVLVICIVHILWYLGFGWADWLIWPAHPMGNGPIWFAILLATLTTVGYIYFGRVKRNKMIQMGFIALLWIFWMNVSNLVFQLPFVNFIDQLI